MPKTPKNRTTSLLLATAALLMAFGPGGDPVFAAPKVGVTAAVNQDARSRPPGGAQSVLTLGKNVVFNEQIITDGDGLVQVLLVDGTTFTVGPNSQLTIDEFVYDPNTGDAKVVATLAKGAFRFIGGQTSRKKGGATIRTPAGSLGIRGAMVEGNVQGGQGTFSMIFGEEVVYTGPGGSQRLFEPGFTLDVKGGGGSPQVRRRTSSDASTFQNALAGGPGQSGGSSRQPTDSGVANSQVSNVNSGAQSVPVPTFRPVESTTLNEVDEPLTDIDPTTEEVIVAPIVTPTPTRKPTVTPPDTLLARMLLAPGTYTTAFGSFGNPGARGLVGSTAATDFNVQLTRNNGRLTGTTPSGGTINLPDLTGTQGDSGLQQFNVSGIGPLGAVSGPAFAGRNDFVAYLLGVGGDPAQPSYLFAGTPTTSNLLLSEASDVRAYTLTKDPIQNVAVPFFNPDLYGSLDNTNQTNLLIVERSPYFFKSFLTWTDISGSGGSQRSATFVTAGGGITDANGMTALNSRRRGSFRGAADGPSFNMRGAPVESIPGAEGYHAYGPNAENFVVGTGVDPADTFVDIPTNYCSYYTCPPPANTYTGDLNFGSIHVADLVSETPKSSLSRTTRTHDGFMAGLAESRSEGFDNPYPVGTNGLPNFSMATDAPSSQMAAVGNVVDFVPGLGVNGVNNIVKRLELTFGVNGGDFGEGAFVNDEFFGATYNNNLAKTRLVTDDAQDVANTSDLTPGSYIVSGRAAPIPGYQHCTSCDYVDWGWWGTRVIADIADGGGTARRDERVHMGTWVAGDITDPADLPTGMSASYAGTVIANIARNGDQYIAAGDFALSIDLDDRSGTFGISALDGQSYAATVQDASTATQALYSSNNLVGTDGLTGTVAGALVNNGTDPAAGTIGQFQASNVGDGDHVIGTFVGDRTSLTVTPGGCTGFC